MVNYVQPPQNPAQANLTPANPTSGTVITSMNINYFNMDPQELSDPDSALRKFPINLEKVRNTLAQQFPDALNVSVSSRTTPPKMQKNGERNMDHQLLAVVGFSTLEEAEFHKTAIKKIIENFDPNRPIETTQTSWMRRLNPAELQPTPLSHGF